MWKHDCGERDENKCRASTGRDGYTKSMAIRLSTELLELTGERPHVILNELHRSKMDANREIGQATFNNQISMVAYNEFHAFIDEARSRINGSGLFLDIHGQIHAKRWHEFGYLLTKTILNRTSHPIQARYSSIKSLASRYPEDEFESIVRGEKSLGYLLEDESQGLYPSIPSPSNPKPLKDDYFAGGYNTRAYGSKYGGAIDAIQVEAHKDVRKKNVYQVFTDTLARAVKRYMDLHYH